MALFAMTFIGCSPVNDERKRAGKVQALSSRLGTNINSERDSAYVDLKEVYVRKRDISYLKDVISKDPDSEASRLLDNLITYIEKRWRMPDKGWTSDYIECIVPYAEKSIALGCSIEIYMNQDRVPEPLIEMRVVYPDDASQLPAVIDLICAFEPQSLVLSGKWENIDFISLLTNLNQLSLENTKAANLESLRCLPSLTRLKLVNAKAVDLTPLKANPNIQFLMLDSAAGLDLSLLSGTSVKVVAINGEL